MLAHIVFRAGDRLRRAAGAALDGIGLGPIQTPARLVRRAPGLELLAYAAPARAGPVVVLVPAPIKRAYIWDLAPEVSVVRRGLARGLRIYLIRWTEPGEAERDFGLADYADRLIVDALDAVEAETGERSVGLAGHSLGGTFAAIFAAVRPNRVRALVLLEAPLHFGPTGAGAFGPLVAATPHARAMIGPLGTVPGTLLDVASMAAAPDVFLWARWADRVASIADPERLVLHTRVERWMLDELPVPGRLFADVVEGLYREDRFMRGVLQVGEHRVGPGHLAAPVLAVIDPRSRVVPPVSVLSFLRAAASAEKHVLHHEREIGVSLQHVGVLVGPRAHRDLWPRILAWIVATCDGVRARGA